MLPGAAVVGWGTALPPLVVTNKDLEAYLDTSDEWITERTGIKERRIGGSVTELATQAGKIAIANSGISPSDIDLLILATTTPDESVPATSALVHSALGLSGAAFDINAACSGFVYGLTVARGAIATGCSRVLLIGADVLSRITDKTDRSTAVLFADGAGAVILERREDGDNFLGWDIGIDGSLHDLLYAELGGYIKMQGRDVFRKAVQAMVNSARSALEKASLTPDYVSLLVPHQANLRIIEAAAARLGIPMERVAVSIDHNGNTSSASIPLALVDAIDAGRIADGDIILLSGFGAGMTWASAVIRWGR